jgi:hypothetical protein
MGHRNTYTKRIRRCRPVPIDGATERDRLAEWTAGTCFNPLDNQEPGVGLQVAEFGIYWTSLTPAGTLAFPHDPSHDADGVSMARYRKKPVVIEAVQVAAVVYNGATCNRSLFKCDVVPQWLEEAFADGTVAVHPSDRDYALLAIKAPEGTMIAEPGYWIIRGVKGELYPCNPDIFEATYEPVVATSFKAR